MTAINIDGNTLVSRVDTHVEADVDHDTVLMHVDSGRFFSLTGTGRAVWAAMVDPITVDHLVERLIVDFAVDRDVCRRDVIALCERLEAQDLIRFA